MSMDAKKLIEDWWTPRKKALLVGLFMSKFSDAGIGLLGFGTRDEMCNVIGLSLGIKPASIKNYRDEFDAIVPESPRRGWDREPRADRVAMYERYKHLDLTQFAAFLENTLRKKKEDALIEKIESSMPQANESFARRLTTGHAAERYFWRNHGIFPEFAGLKIKDTTQHGCGFDFRMSGGGADYGVEVKGMAAASGAIAMTEKEYYAAQVMRDDYFLCVVKNMREEPLAQLYRNPLRGKLKFSQSESSVVQIRWTAAVA